jgi:hypothetical protein
MARLFFLDHEPGLGELTTSVDRRTESVLAGQPGRVPRAPDF